MTGGGEGGGETDGVNHIQMQPTVGKVGQGLGVGANQSLALFATSAGKRLTDAQGYTRLLAAQDDGDGAGNNRLADLGISTGDQQARLGKC